MHSQYEQLLEYIRTLQVIDTHEHLPPYESLADQNTDILSEYLEHYFGNDLISAGLSQVQFEQAKDVSQPLMSRWRMIEPFWKAAQFTGYAQSLQRSVQLLYKLPGLNADTLEAANEAFIAGRAGAFRRVFQQGKIRTAILNEGTVLDVDREFFTPVFAAHAWISPPSIEAMTRMAAEVGVRLHSLGDYEQACRIAMSMAKSKGACALKCSLAYSRSLAFGRPSRAAAEAAFADAWAFRQAVAWCDRPAPSSVFQDHMMHLTCALAGELDLTYQIHTGLQAGNGNLLKGCDPLLLNNLFYEYPDTRFDIFHIGYPWHLQLSALAKCFPNVYIDMCWAHIISPHASRMALSEYLDAVPANKIMAFGGDFCFIDAVLGHLFMAQENVARVLYDKIQLDIMDMEQAQHVAGMLFYENPARLFCVGSACKKHVPSAKAAR